MDSNLAHLLAREGPLSAQEAARLLGVDPITIKRQAAVAGAGILVVGRGKNTRYSLPQPTITGAAQWPLFWAAADGVVTEFALASHLQPDVLHIYGSGAGLGINVTTARDLPWILTPLKLRGYLGRASRGRLGAVTEHWDTQPERWSLAQQLFAAQSATLDHAGAILLGEAAVRAWQAQPSPPQRDDPSTLAMVYDGLADEATQGRVAGSSADGEQPKFSTRVIDPDGTVREVLVKFSPPRGTPFGERWNDLLHAEAIAADVLRANGFATPDSRIVMSSKRTYFESTRIDRVSGLQAASRGRRHLLPLAAVHAAFVAGAPQSWPNTIARLVAQKRIAVDALATTQALYAFGQLIGNTDMHFGNLGVIVDSPNAISKGRLTLAPCYDMLPMRFSPGPHSDIEFTAFSNELSAALPPPIAHTARMLADDFWRRVSQADAVSEAWRSFAGARHKNG
jgi:hypothetical protein